MLALVVPGLLACEREPASGGPDAGPAAPAPFPTASPDAAAHRAAPPAERGARPPACRIVSGEGDVRPDADPTRWLALPERASFTVRTTEGRREVRFEGPGRVLACGEDGALLADGSAVALPGAGEAPGNEQWVGTRCGAARWVGGVHRVTANANECTIHVLAGALDFVPADDATVEVPKSADAGAPGSAAPSDGGAARVGAASRGDDGTWRLEGPAGLRVRVAPGDGRGRAASACAAASAAEQAKGAELRALEGPGLATVGEAAAEHVRLRRRARALCATSRAREGATSLPDAGAIGR